MGHDLNDRTIAFLVAYEGVEQVELTEPWQAVEEAAGSPSSLVHLRPERHLDRTGGEVVDTAQGSRSLLGSESVRGLITVTREAC